MTRQEVVEAVKSAMLAANFINVGCEEGSGEIIFTAESPLLIEAGADAAININIVDFELDVVDPTSLKNLIAQRVAFSKQAAEDRAFLHLKSIEEKKQKTAVAKVEQQKEFQKKAALDKEYRDRLASLRVKK